MVVMMFLLEIGGGCFTTDNVGVIRCPFVLSPAFLNLRGIFGVPDRLLSRSFGALSSTFLVMMTDGFLF